jgi:tetratricopeptide (TPR) repeat protein
MKNIRKLVWVGALGSLWCLGAQADELDCGSLQNAYGPYDYTNADHRKTKIPIVESNHFNADVESLRRGQSSVYPMDDIHYTLRAVPNHHRALASMARYYLEGGKVQKFYSADCYFERALRFKQNDGNVHLLYGMYLHRLKQYPRAEEEYQQALDYLADSADANYDLGLLYTDIGRWSEAKRYAIVAYRLGYPFPALKHRLQKSGNWTEADDAAATPPAPQAPQATDTTAPAAAASDAVKQGEPASDPQG